MVARNVVSPGAITTTATSEKTMIAMYGVLNRGMHLAQQLRQLAVLAHRERQPREPDQGSVGGDQQDHRGEDRPRRPRATSVSAGTEPDVLDDPQHRVVRVRGAELGRELAAASWVTGIADRAIAGSSA